MFIELHAQSAFSFLEGAELPEAFAAEAARLEMPAVALVDRDGVYGAPRLTRAAASAGVKPIVGSEITLASQDLDEAYTLLSKIESKESARLLQQLEETRSTLLTDDIVGAARTLE